MRASPARFLSLAFLILSGLCAGQQPERVRPIEAPATPLPSEAASAGTSKFSFIVYGDTRGRQDGKALQYEHSMVINGILTQVERLKNGDFPVRFVLSVSRPSSRS